MSQQWIVGVIVFAAACYALWHGLPARARLRLARVHPVLGRESGCADCRQCGACETLVPRQVEAGDPVDGVAGARQARSVPVEGRGR